jgi:hypothetical protein
MLKLGFNHRNTLSHNQPKLTGLASVVFFLLVKGHLQLNPTLLQLRALGCLIRQVGRLGEVDEEVGVQHHQQPV